MRFWTIGGYGIGPATSKIQPWEKRDWLPQREPKTPSVEHGSGSSGLCRRKNWREGLWDSCGASHCSCWVWKKRKMWLQALSRVGGAPRAWLFWTAPWSENTNLTTALQAILLTVEAGHTKPISIQKGQWSKLASKKWVKELYVYTVHMIHILILGE